MLTAQRSRRVLLATMLFGLGACEGSTGPEAFLECDRVGTISNGDTKSANIGASDCDFGDGEYIDFYRFELSSSQTVTITMRSEAIDSFLLLFNDAETIVDADDDSGGGVDGLDAQIVILLAAGDYVIAASGASSFETGAYTLSFSH